MTSTIILLLLCREDLKLCAVAGRISICSRAGHQAATILRQPTTGTQEWRSDHAKYLIIYKNRSKNGRFLVLAYHFGRKMTGLGIFLKYYFSLKGSGIKKSRLRRF